MTSFQISLSVPFIGGREVEYVSDAVRRGDLAQGEYIGRFEQMVADYVGARYAVAVSSGTAALHLALLAAGVGPGDEVIVPALTFIATANAVRYCGAEPVFVDVEEDAWTMDPGKAQAAITDHTAAIMPVHLLGHPASPVTFAKMGHAWDVPIIWDAAEALGAEFLGARIGRQEGINCFSFNGNKTITCAGGGMITTDDERIARKVRHLATQARCDPVEMRHDEPAHNYRLSNVHAAIGVAQLEQLPDFLTKKRRIAERYTAELADIPGITLPKEAAWARSSWWLYTVRIDEKEYGIFSRGLIRHLAELGIESRPMFTPLHLQPAYKKSNIAFGAEGRVIRLPEPYFPVAETIWREAVSLPSSVGLSESDQQAVIEAIRGARRT